MIYVLFCFLFFFKAPLYLCKLLEAKQTPRCDSHPVSESSTDELLMSQVLIYYTPRCYTYQPLSSFINFGNNTQRNCSHVVHYYIGLQVWVWNRWQITETWKKHIFLLCFNRDAFPPCHWSRTKIKRLQLIRFCRQCTIILI